MYARSPTNSAAVLCDLLDAHTGLTITGHANEVVTELARPTAGARQAA